MRSSACDNRLGQGYRRTKVRPCLQVTRSRPRRQYERDEHIRSHGYPPVEPHWRAWKNARADRLEAEMQPRRRLADLLLLGILIAAGHAPPTFGQAGSEAAAPQAQTSSGR